MLSLNIKSFVVWVLGVLVFMMVVVVAVSIIGGRCVAWGWLAF